MGILSFIRRAAEPATELFFLPDCSLSFCGTVQIVWGCWETLLIICPYADDFCYVKMKVGMSWIFQADQHFLWFSCSWPQVIRGKLWGSPPWQEKSAICICKDWSLPQHQGINYFLYQGSAVSKKVQNVWWDEAKAGEYAKCEDGFPIW